MVPREILGRSFTGYGIIVYIACHAVEVIRSKVECILRNTAKWQAIHSRVCVSGIYSGAVYDGTFWIIFCDFIHSFICACQTGGNSENIAKIEKSFTIM